MKITCIKCLKEKSVNSNILVKRIVKAGSYEKLINEYECRDCRPKMGIENVISKANAILNTSKT